MLGLALLSQPPAIRNASPWRRRWQPALLACLTLLVLLVAEAAGTVRMVGDTDATTPHPRSQAPVLLAEDMREVRALLEESGPTNLLLATNGITGPLHNSWLSYFGRQHRIWLTNPLFVDMVFTDSFPPDASTLSQLVPKKMPSGGLAHERPLPCALDLKSLPPGVLVLEQSVPAFDSVARGDTTDLWKGRAFRLWKSSSGEWALPLRLDTPYGIEHADGRPFFWMGEGETALEVLAHCAGTVSLSADFVAGPDLASSPGCRLQVRTGSGRQFEVPISGGPQTLIVPLEAGRTTLWLTPLGKSASNPRAGGDPRTLLLLVRELAFRFAPGQR